MKDVFGSKLFAEPCLTSKNKRKQLVYIDYLFVGGFRYLLLSEFPGGRDFVCFVPQYHLVPSPGKLEYLMP